ITSTTTDSAGNTVIHFSDGKNVTIPKGQDGHAIDIQSVTKNPQGDTVITFTNGKTVTIPKGEKGDRGENGHDGQNGTSISITSTTT
ncbi:hypothetical protein WL551_12565, partial [Staphylococcus hominis]